MCVLMDVLLNGLLFKPTVSPLPNPVFATNGEISEMLFSLRPRILRFVKLDSAEMSEMLLYQRYRISRLVKLESTDISEMLFSLRFRNSRFVKLDSADISEMLFPSRPRFSRFVKLDSADISEMLQNFRQVGRPRCYFKTQSFQVRQVGQCRNVSRCCFG